MWHVMMQAIMGGLEHARFIEFNWRGWPTSNPEEPQPSAMPFHPDTDGNTEDGDMCVVPYSYRLTH